jgi:curved DNA-binding protein CbpA
MLGIRLPRRGKDWDDVIYLTPMQALEGARGRYNHRRRSKELIITIPPGVREGQKIRLKGMGAQGKEGGEPGDLYLKVKIKRPLLQRIRELLRK